MAEDVVTIPILKLEIPKPKPWDFAALLVTGIGIAAMLANIFGSGLVGESVSSTMTLAYVTISLLVCVASLLVLGKTAKEGTIHGNLLAVTGMGVGLMASMLAAALWALA